MPLQDVDSAIRELENVLRDLKFCGVEIASHVNGVSIGDARFEPFFEKRDSTLAPSRRLPRATRGASWDCRRQARSLNLWIFPVAVLGSSAANSIQRGYL